MDLIFLYEINKSMAEKEELTSQNYHTIFEITRKDLSVARFGRVAFWVPKGQGLDLKWLTNWKYRDP